MKILTVFICNNCDSGVFMRCGGDIRSCECTYLNVDEWKGPTAADDKKNFIVVENVPFKQTDDVLLYDFESGRDRFGLFKNATKMVAHLKNTSRVVEKPVRRRFDDDAAGMMSLEDN